MADSRCWSTLSASIRAAACGQLRAYSDHKSDHQSDHDWVAGAIAALGRFRSAELSFEATLLGKLRAATAALPEAAKFDSAFFLAAAALVALLGGFCAAAPLPEAATFDSAACLAPEVFAALLGGFCAALRPEDPALASAACLAPAAFAALLGIALSFAATALLLGIALAAARAIAAVLPDVATFARDAAMLFG